jgi:hypothetical protein
VTQANEVTNGKVYSEKPNVDDMSELKTMLASTLATIGITIKTYRTN